MQRTARTAADGVGATEWLAGDERAWLGCGREMGSENCADGVGARERLEMCGGRI